MGDIIDNEEIDRDTVDPEVLEQQFSKKYKLLTETVVSLKKSYIHIMNGSNSQKIAVGLLDHSIEVYQISNSSLSKLCRLSGHKKALTEVVFCPKEDHVLYSAGNDGVLKMWDTRAGGTCVQEFKDEDEQLLKQFECMDVSCNGRVLCAGSQVAEDDAYLVFWDNRNTCPLGGYWNSHTDDITQVKFHKQKTEMLVSGSLDGLLNVYNTLEPSEDDALTYSLNVGNSVERISWLDKARVACITQSQDLQLWDVDSGDMIGSFTREKVSRSIRRSKYDDCYLVDALPAAGGAMLLAGSYGGDGRVVRGVTVLGKRLVPLAALRENTQTVRCCWHDPQRDILVTAGEGGAVSVWTALGDNSHAGDDSHDVGATRARLHANRHKPY